MNARSQLETRYTTVIGDRMGLDYDVEASGFLIVHVAGRQCFVLLDPHDPGFLRLGTTEPWPEDTPRSRAAAAAERVNRRCPGVKATLSDDLEVVVLSAEMLVGHDGCLPNASLLAAVLHRMTLALADAVDVFAEDLVLQAFAADPTSTAALPPDAR